LVKSVRSVREGDSLQQPNTSLTTSGTLAGARVASAPKTINLKIN
jgi:hypothetical protein